MPVICGALLRAIDIYSTLEVRQLQIYLARSLLWFMSPVQIREILRRLDIGDAPSEAPGPIY